VEVLGALMARIREPGDALRRGRVLAAALLVCASAARAGGAAETTQADEERVRAAFLFQVAQYVHWPADAFSGPRAPLRFCAAGVPDSFVKVLEDTVSGKSISGRAIAAGRATHPDELAVCHVVFVGYPKEKQIRDLLAHWRFPPVMLVGETRGFAEMGGTVNLRLEGGKVSFEVNVVAAERSRLEFRSQLLRFARIVSGGQTGAK
jgi:hypothetical protein